MRNQIYNTQEYSLYNNENFNIEERLTDPIMTPGDYIDGVNMERYVGWHTAGSLVSFADALRLGKKDADFAINALSAYRLHPGLALFGGSKLEQFAARQFGRGARKILGPKGFNSVVNAMESVGLKYLYDKDIGQSGYKHALAGWNVVRPKALSSSNLERLNKIKKYGSKIQTATGSLFTLNKANSFVGAMGSTAGKAAIGGMIGGNLTGMFTDSESARTLGSVAGMAVGTGLGLAYNTGIIEKTGKKIAGKKISSVVSRVLANKFASAAIAVSTPIARWAGILDLILTPFTLSSEIRINNRITSALEYENNRNANFLDPSNAEIVNVNAKYSAQNRVEQDYLLSSPNLARDEAYRFVNPTFGF
jgi:hypothetical protein